MSTQKRLKMKEKKNSQDSFLHIRISSELYKQLEVCALNNYHTVSSFVRQLIINEVKKNDQ